MVVLSDAPLSAVFVRAELDNTIPFKDWLDNTIPFKDWPWHTIPFKECRIVMMALIWNVSVTSVVMSEMSVMTVVSVFSSSS